MYCIQESDKPNKILRFFHKVALIEDKIILPIIKEDILTKKEIEVFGNKIEKILEETYVKRVVISKDIQKQEEFKNRLYSSNLDIIEGKWLFEILVPEVLEYIINKREMKKEETAIAILVNDLSDYMLENVKQIAREYKRVNIITNHPEKFRKIEEQILDNEGILINITNNKRKSLVKMPIILNVDFPTELVNLYQIKEEAYIINLKQNVKINKKRFNGMNINDYEISYLEKEDFDYDKKERYRQKDIYEAKCNKKQTYESIRKQLEKDEVKVIQLIGYNNSL